MTSPPKPAQTPPVAGAGDTPAAADAPRHESPADPSRDEHAPCAGSVQGHTPASSSPGSLQPIDGGDTTSGNTSTVSDRSSSLSPSNQRERRPRGPPLPRLLRRQFRHRGWVYSGEQTRLTSRKRPSDIAHTSFSPGVRRLMGRLGGKEAFDEARADLETLAGIVVQTKQVERVSEAIGEQIEAVNRKERKAALSGKVVLLYPVPKMYVAIDGTGVPMVPSETRDRPGKDGLDPPRPARSNWGVSSPRPAWMRRGERFETRDPPPTSAPSKPQRSSVVASSPRPSAAAAGAPTRPSSWATGPCGSGISPTSTSRAPSRSSISTTLANTSANSPRSSTARVHPRPRPGRSAHRRTGRRQRRDSHLEHEPSPPQHRRPAG